MTKSPQWYRDNGMVHVPMTSENQVLKYNPNYVESLRRAGLRPVITTSEYGHEYMSLEQELKVSPEDSK